MVSGGRPSLSHVEIKEILKNNYGIAKIESIEPLVSFWDQNFLIQTEGDGRQVLLKIMNWKTSEDRGLHDELNELMTVLSQSVRCPLPLRTNAGTKMVEFKTQVEGQEKTCFVRLFDYIPGSILEKGKLTRQQSAEWGKLVGEIHHVFQQQTEYPIIRERNTLFSWINTPRVIDYLDVLDNDEDRTLIRSVITEYEERLLPMLLKCKREILHGDINDTNILSGPDGHVNAVLDLFECQGGPFVCDLAVAFAYLAVSVPDLESNLDIYFREAANEYNKCMPNVLFEFGDIELFVLMICGRLAQSLTLGLAAYRDTGDTYCLNSQPTGWKAIRRIFSQKKNFEHVFGHAFRATCESGPVESQTSAGDPLRSGCACR